MPDYSQWPNKEEASALTGIPVRTLERLVQRGEIKQGYKRVPHRRPMAVLDPEGLQRAMSEGTQETGLVKAQPKDVAPIPPRQSPATTPPPDRATDRATVPPPIPQTGEIVLRRASRSRYVTLPEAKEYIGLPQAYLERLIKDGQLPAIKSGAWFVRTADLDRL